MNRLKFLLTGAGAISLLALGATSAFAAPAHVAAAAHTATANRIAPQDVSPVQLYDEDGTSGWYTQSFGTQYKYIRGSYDLNAQNTDAILLGFGGGQGFQLCNSNSGKFVQAGTVYDPGTNTYTFGYLTGVFVTGGIVTDGTAGDLCDGNNFLNEHAFSLGVFTALGTIPQGHEVEASIQVIYGSHGRPDGDLITAEDTTIGVADYQAYLSFHGHHSAGYYNEEGGGFNSDVNVLSAPAVNDIGDFTGVCGIAVGSNHCYGLAEWNAVSVSSSGDGLAPPLMAPTLITPGTAETCTTVLGHWGPWYDHHTKRNWHPAHKVCSGGGPSSWTVLAGTPIGF